MSNLAVAADGLIMLSSCVTSDPRSRKWTLSSPKETGTAGHGWNIYVVDTVSPLALYQEMVNTLSRLVVLPPLERLCIFFTHMCILFVTESWSKGKKCS